MTEVREGPALTEEQIDQMLQGVADAFSVQRRSRNARFVTDRAGAVTCWDQA